VQTENANKYPQKFYILYIEIFKFYNLRQRQRSKTKRHPTLCNVDDTSEWSSRTDETHSGSSQPINTMRTSTKHTLSCQTTCWDSN